MGKGRTPCCDKAGVKRGPWSEAEDLKLISFIHKHGHSNWRALPKLAGLARCGKSCRLRWVNYLRPDLRRGNFSTEEEETIIKLHESLGNKWSKIASHFPGRTDNEIKNVWNTHLKKRLKAKTRSSSNIDHNNASSCTDQPNNDHEEQHIMGESDLPLESSVNDENMVDALKDHDQVQQQEEEQIVSTGCVSTISDEYYQCSVPAAHDQQTSSSSTSFSSNNEARDVEDLGNNHVISHNDQNEMIHEGLIEIPFEPDLDLWDMLDDQYYDSSTTTVVDHADPHAKDDIATLFVQPAIVGNDPQVHQQKISSSAHQVRHDDSGSPEGEAGKGHDQDINESWQWWFGYLENELGLEATTHQNQNICDQVNNKMPGPQQPMEMKVSTTCSNASSTTTADQELLMLINEDIEPVDSYFKSWEWPSSPNYMPTL